MSPRPQLLIAFLLLASLVTIPAAAQLRITIPKGSKPTPVQKLNQQGVEAVQDRNFEEAKKLFYQAYLLDPNDPFTLNNLGYVAELEGQVERAQRFYTLAAEHATDATVDKASSSGLKGKSVAEVAGKAEDQKLKINQLNLRAIALLMQDRAPEADLILQKALEINPKNAFTLNNLGFAKEKEGDFENALSFYTSAANLRSDEPVIVTPQKDRRGKPISEVAAKNADDLRKLIRDSRSVEARVARLNLQGVSAINRNEPELAQNYFEQAYKLDPDNALTLNNMGYAAELGGDRETADYYYARAQQANGEGDRVDIATRQEMEGKRVREIAVHGETEVQARIEATRRVRALQGGPIVLRDRNGNPLSEPNAPPEGILPPPSGTLPNVLVPTVTAPQGPAQSGQSQGGLLMPLPDDQQPPAVQQPSQQQPGGVLMPLPENQQPPAAQDPAQPPPNGGLMMPLPEDQQPPAAQKP